MSINNVCKEKLVFIDSRDERSGCTVFADPFHPGPNPETYYIVLNENCIVKKILRLLLAGTVIDDGQSAITTQNIVPGRDCFGVLLILLKFIASERHRKNKL